MDEELVVIKSRLCAGVTFLAGGLVAGNRSSSLWVPVTPLLQPPPESL
jgi:hypothetical protein